MTNNVGAPNKLREPTKVSANIETSLHTLIRLCKFEIRPLIEKGFEASVPKGMSAWDYALSMKDREVLKKKRKMEEARATFEEAEQEYLMTIKQKEMMIENSLDVHVPNFDNLKDKLKPHAEEIISRYQIKHESWRGDQEIIPSIEKEYGITMTYNHLYDLYDYLREIDASW